jgi:hypothetical protein
VTQPLRNPIEPTEAVYSIRVFADSSVQVKLRLSYSPAVGIPEAQAIAWLIDPLRNPWLAHLWGKPQLQWQLKTNATEWVAVGEGRIPFFTFVQWPLAFPNDTTRFELSRADALLYAEFALRLPAQRSRAMLGPSGLATDLPLPPLRYEIQLPGAPEAHNADSMDVNLVGVWHFPQTPTQPDANAIEFRSRIYHFWLALGGLSFSILLLMLGVVLVARRLYRRRQQAERAQIEYQRDPPKPHWR